jgi:uncharacterized protein
MNQLDTNELVGAITAVPVVSMQSFRQRSPFVVPEDGKNLNRSFPGSREGSYTDALARGIFDQLIAPADALIDLHGGDQVEHLEPFTIYAASPVEEQAHSMAVAFGLPYVVREEPHEGGLGGMTITAAADAGVPAIIAEAGGRGILEDAAVELLVAGVRNTLRRLEMLPGEIESPWAQQLVGLNVWLRARNEGWWEPVVAPGDRFEQGAPLGCVRNLWGDVLEEVAAPADGVVLFVTSSPAVSADGLVVGLGANLSPL